MPEDLLAQFAEARTDVLGPRAERTASKPAEQDDGTLAGGTLFERQEKPVGVHDARAYTLACSDQTQNSLYSPVAWGKLDKTLPNPGSVDELPADMQIRAKYLAVCISL